MASPDVVDTPQEAAALELAPLLVREPLEAFLDEHGIGSGRLEAERIGEGHSNITFLVPAATLARCCAARRARRCRPRPTTSCARPACCARSRTPRPACRACSPYATTSRCSACPST